MSRTMPMHEVRHTFVHFGNPAVVGFGHVTPARRTSSCDGRTEGAKEETVQKLRLHTREKCCTKMFLVNGDDFMKQVELIWGSVKTEHSAMPLQVLSAPYLQDRLLGGPN